MAGVRCFFRKEIGGRERVSLARVMKSNVSMEIERLNE